MTLRNEFLIMIEWKIDKSEVKSKSFQEIDW